MPNLRELSSTLVICCALSTTAPGSVAGFSPRRVAHVPTATLHGTAKNRRRPFVPLAAVTDEDDNRDAANLSDNAEDNFDGKGFAGYLAPYAVALVGSIAVTAAFVKFVLMDY